MASSSIQSIWRKSAEDWSQETQKILQYGLKPTTIKHYNAWWKRFTAFCQQEGQNFLPAQGNTVADFLEHVTRSTAKPGGSVNQACAAIGIAHRAAKLEDLTNTNLMLMFRKGLINIHTKRVQKKATPINQNLLNELFLKWEDNEKLSDTDLRRKALALCYLWTC